MSKLPVAEALEKMAGTFRERNAIYGDNWETVGRMMTALYPSGITVHGEAAFNVHVWLSLIIGKLSRFVNSGHTHLDSLHDIAVYTAMLEQYVTLEEKRKGVEGKDGLCCSGAVGAEFPFPGGPGYSLSNAESDEVGALSAFLWGKKLPGDQMNLDVTDLARKILAWQKARR